MLRSEEKGTVVECFFDGARIPIPEELFFSMLLGKPLQRPKYVRYKEGAKMYSMCESEFNKLVHDADAVYKRNSMALINLDVLDNFMEFFHVGKGG